MWMKRIQKDPELSEVIRRLVGCSKKLSYDMLTFLSNPRPQKDFNYLNKKFKINCKIKSFENKNQLKTWITTKLAKRWAEHVDYPDKSGNMQRYYNGLKNKIFEMCDATRLFTKEEADAIKYAFRVQQEELERGDTLPLDDTLEDTYEDTIELRRGDTIPTNMLFTDWFNS